MRRTGRPLASGAAIALLTLTSCASTDRQPRAFEVPAHGVIGVTDAHLDPSFWLRRARRGDAVMLDASAIAALNRHLERVDSTVHDIEQLPDALARDEIRRWIEEISTRPDRLLHDERGAEIESAMIDRWLDAIALDAVPETRPARYGLVVRRADLRTFPTRQRVFSRKGDTDIDRFQEHALFPGTPVAIVHESRDRDWWFVVSPLYAAWVEKAHIAEGPRSEVFAYTRKTPYLVVTGAGARTLFTPERPEVSELNLEMGVRVPRIADWPPDRPVNGQHAYTAHVIELPMRGADGALQFTPALLPRTAEVSTDYLPFTRANVVRQSFKFLGERYGWGHSFNARDCSGFVSEVYRSFGVTLPRNTKDQSVSPAFEKVRLTANEDGEARAAALDSLDVGDLVFIPRHVMLVIGRDRGVPYVIHDTTGIRYRDGAGRTIEVPLNSVAVTPLTPLLLDDGRSVVEHIHSIVRIRPQGAP